MLEAKPGIGGIQTLLAAEQLRQGTLVQLLPDYRWEPPTLYTIYPTRREGPAADGRVNQQPSQRERYHTPLNPAFRRR